MVPGGQQDRGMLQARRTGEGESVLGTRIHDDDAHLRSHPREDGGRSGQVARGPGRGPVPPGKSEVQAKAALQQGPGTLETFGRVAHGEPGHLVVDEGAGMQGDAGDRVDALGTFDAVDMGVGTGDRTDAGFEDRMEVTLGVPEVNAAGVALGPRTQPEDGIRWECRRAAVAPERQPDAVGMGTIGTGPESGKLDR